jgi:hypothetical protein
VVIEIEPATPMQSVMIDIPVPPTITIPVDGLDGKFDHVQSKNGMVNLFCERIEGKKRIELPVIGALAGDARIDVVSREMYSSRVAAAAPGRIVVE